MVWKFDHFYGISLQMDSESVAFIWHRFRIHSQLFQENDQFVIEFVRRLNWTEWFWWSFEGGKKCKIIYVTHAVPLTFHYHCWCCCCQRSTIEFFERFQSIRSLHQMNNTMAVCCPKYSKTAQIDSWSILKWFD